MQRSLSIPVCTAFSARSRILSLYVSLWVATVAVVKDFCGRGRD